MNVWKMRFRVNLRGMYDIDNFVKTAIENSVVNSRWKFKQKS